MIDFNFVMTGTKYRPADVNALVLRLREYYPDSTYTCYTDQPFSPVLIDNIQRIDVGPLHLRGVWNKLAMFREVRPEFNNIVYFDLDTIIRADLRPFLKDVDFSKLTVVDCFWKDPNIVRLTNYDVLFNSSVMAWNMTMQPSLTDLWGHFAHSGYRDYFLKKYVGMDRYLGHEDFSHIEWDYFSINMIRSHKYQDVCFQDAPVVTFEEVDFGLIDPTTIA